MMNWQTIFQHLQKQGFDVYPLGQHKGICTSPYIVLRNNGTTLSRGAEQALYELLLYMPVDRNSEFEDFIREVKLAMNRLYPALKLVIPDDTHYLDEDVRGYMTSLTYGVVKKSEINQVKG